MTAFTHKLDQVTYPKMERQDLTQGQLGSFKFTPTDEVRPVFSRTSPRLAQRFIHSLAHHPRADFPSLTVPNATVDSGHPAYQPSGTALSPTRFNSTLFDTYFKQDLEKSRLQLGPNALRAAMDGSPTSPKRQSTHSKDLGYVSTASIMPQYTPTQNGNGMYSISTQNAIPNPAAVPGATPLVDSNFLQASLIRALATEQQAHQATKDALENEKALRIEAEATAQKYLEHNRSLIGSVNMLKSVVQHNMKKEQQITASLEREHLDQETLVSDQPQTLLHDAVKNLRRPTNKLTSGNIVDHSQIFNLSLVDTHGSPALRRHFSTTVEQTPTDANEVNGPTDQDYGQSHDEDINGATRRQKSDETWETGDTTMGADSDEMVLDETSPVLKSTAINTTKSHSGMPVKLMAMPFDPHVKWHKDPIFDDQEDKLDRLRTHASLFAKHPVRYFPKKSDKNLYRTVIMDFLPNDTTYKELLNNIRGGAIEEIQLFGPIGQSTNFMTARVIFNYELGARSVYMQGQNPGIVIKGQRIRVWQVLEATYPRTGELETEIFEEGYTRLLLIENATQASLSKLPQKLDSQVRAGAIVEIGLSYDDLPMVEFTSVKECSKALKLLINDPDFGGCRFDFEEDPCINPY